VDAIKEGKCIKEDGLVDVKMKEGNGIMDKSSGTNEGMENGRKRDRRMDRWMDGWMDACMEREGRKTMN